MPRIFGFFGFIRPVRTEGPRPSYAHHIHSVTDMRTGETINQQVRITSRCEKGRIRTTDTLSRKV